MTGAFSKDHILILLKQDIEKAMERLEKETKALSSEKSTKLLFYAVFATLSIKGSWTK